jgi:chromosome segregation ATPase
MIKHVTEKETQLTNMLHTCTEALTQVTAERDKLERSIDQWRVDYHELQLDYEKLAAELKALRDSGVELPEKSVINTHIPTGIKIYGYTADQMRDYGDRRAMAERERIIGQLLKLGVLGDGTYIVAIRKGE